MAKDHATKCGLAIAIIAASLPMFMASLDNLVMTFALPVVQTDLKASVVQLQWFVNAYTVAFATLMLPMSALGDRFGRRKIFTTGIILFTVASITAAYATSAELLIIARALQGIGAAAIVPLSLTLLSVAAGASKRAIAIGIWGGVNGLGIAAGPIIGGAVVEGFHWSGIFWLNVPIGVIALILINLGLQESRGSSKPFDVIGVAFAIIFVLPLIWAVVEGHEQGWFSGPILTAFGLATLGLTGFLTHETKSKAAFLPIKLFRERIFTVANASGFLLSAGVFGAIFLLSQFLQISMGYGALEAGVRAAPWTLAPMIAAPISGFVVQKNGVRPVLAIGLGLQTIALAWMATVITATVTYAEVVVPMLLAGIGMGMTFAPLATAVLIRRPEHEHGIASGVNSTLRELGIAVGIAVATVVFTSNGNYLPGQPFVDGLNPTLVLCGVLTGIATLLAFVLPKQAHHTDPVQMPVTVNTSSSAK